MKLPGMTIVKEESNRIDADNVAAFLRSKGLDAVVSSDDGGGELPSLEQTRFVQVIVPESEAARARELIAGVEAGADEDEGEGESEPD